MRAIKHLIAIFIGLCVLAIPMFAGEKSMFGLLKKLFGGSQDSQEQVALVAADDAAGSMTMKEIEEEPEPAEPVDMMPDELKERMKTPGSFVLLDVREDHELQSQGWIPGALHIPQGDVPDQLAGIDKEKDIIVYCRSGRRSFAIGSYLLENGYEKVYNLDGGILAWGGEVKMAE